MSVNVSSNTLLTWGTQDAKGTPQGTPNFSIPFTDEAPMDVDFALNDLRRAGDGRYLVDSFKQNQKHPFSFECLATPELLAYFYAAILGADSKAGEADPYTHTLTYLADGRQYVTLRKKLDTNIVLEFWDAKLATLTMTWTAGEEVKIKCEGMAINSKIDTTEDSQDRDGDDPYMGYDAEGFINIVSQGRENFKCTSLTITITINTEELMSDTITINDLIDLGVDVTAEASIIVEDTTNFYKKINFYNTNDISEEVYTGQLQWGARYYNSSSKERIFHITIPKLRFTPVGYPTAGEPGVINQTIAGVAQKSGTAVTIISGYSTDAYEEGDFDTPSDAYDCTEFCPVVDGEGKADLFCGTENWESAGAGQGQTYTGQEAIGTPGAVKFSVTSGNWTTFANKVHNGMKTIKMPKSEDNDQSGGDISVMYNYLAWYYAFNADNSDIVISDDGSVYKTSILAANLVVDSHGIIGEAGGNPTTSSANIIDVVIKNAVADDLA